jgi:hypothetical protein
MYLREMSAEEFHAAALPYIRKGVKIREIDTVYAAKLLQELRNAFGYSRTG